MAETKAKEVDSTKKEQRILTEHEKMILLNGMDEEALMTLKGIGPVMAKKIIEYRHSRGPFVTLNELMAVKGIGQKKYEKIIKQLN